MFFKIITKRKIYKFRKINNENHIYIPNDEIYLLKFILRNIDKDNIFWIFDNFIKKCM